MKNSFKIFKTLLFFPILILAFSFSTETAKAGDYLSMNLVYGRDKDDGAVTDGDLGSNCEILAGDTIRTCDIDPGGTYTITSAQISWTSGWASPLPAMGAGGKSGTPLGYIPNTEPFGCIATTSFPGATSGNSGNPTGFGGGRICEVAFNTNSANTGSASFTFYASPSATRGYRMLIAIASNSGTTNREEDFYLRVTPNFCYINTFFADSSLLTNGDTTTLRFTLSGSFDWTLSVLSGTDTAFPQSGTSSSGAENTTATTGNQTYRLSCNPGSGLPVVTDTVTVAHRPAATQLVCNPSSQTVNTSQNANFTASGGSGIPSNYTWTASGAQTPAGSGANFSTQYSTAGGYTVTLRDISTIQSTTCAVTVNAVAPPVVCGDGNIGGLEVCDAGLGNNGACPRPCRGDCLAVNICPFTVSIDATKQSCSGSLATYNIKAVSTADPFIIQAVSSTGVTNDMTGTEPVTTVSGRDYLTGNWVSNNMVFNLLKASDRSVLATKNVGATGCVVATCGNGTIESGESCDDGVNNGACPGRTCSALCAIQTCPATPVCGNGTVEVGEVCDQGSGGNGTCPRTCNSTCSATNSCVAQFCGNGVIEGGEQCDNAGANGTCPSLCSSTCTSNTCVAGTANCTVLTEDPRANAPVYFQTQYTGGSYAWWYGISAIGFIPASASLNTNIQYYTFPAPGNYQVCVGYGPPAPPNCIPTAICDISVGSSLSGGLSDLVITDLHFTDITGATKTNFAPNERIYPSFTIRNSGVNYSGYNFYNYIYKHAPSSVAMNTIGDGGIVLENVVLNPGVSRTYSVTSNTNKWFTNNYFTQITAGSYTGRAFADGWNCGGACGVNESNEGNNQLTAAYTVGTPAAPIISLSTNSLSFSSIAGGTAPVSQIVTITNTGNATMNWSYSRTNGGTWCSASPASGTIAQGSTQNITISVTSMASAGTYTDCGIRISDTNASNNPQDISITYTVSPPNPPGDPESVLGDNSVAARIIVSWSPPSSGGSVSDYTVFRTTGAAPTSGNNLPACTNISNSPCVDTTCAVGNTYHYWVKANGPGGSSNYVAMQNNGLACLGSTARMSNSDKDILSINGTALSPVPTSCNTTDPVIRTFRLGDVVKFRINLCNNSPSSLATASNIQVTDGFVNLILDPSAEICYNSEDTEGNCSGGERIRTTGGGPTYSISGSVPMQTIVFTLPNNATYNIPQGQSRYITIQTITSVLSASVSSTLRFQNWFNISYNNGASQTSTGIISTPYYLMYTNSGGPKIIEVAP